MNTERYPLKVPASIYRFIIDAAGKMYFDFSQTGVNDLFLAQDWQGELTEDKLRQNIITDDWQSFMNSIYQSYQLMSEWSQEFFLAKKDGSLRRVLAKSSPKKREDGAVAWDGVAIDITREFEAYKKARELQDRLQYIESQVPGVIYQFQMFKDGSVAVPYVSANSKKYLNFSNTLIYDNTSSIFSSVHPDDIEKLQQSVAISFQTMMPWKARFRVCFDDGLVKYAVGNSQPEKQPDGSVIWTGFLTDVTTEIEAQKKAEEGQQFFQNIFREHSAIMVIVDNEAGRIVDVNEAAASFYGYSVEEMRDMPISNINILPADELNARLAKAKNKEQREFIMPHRLANGEIRKMQAHTAPVTYGSKKVLSSILTDVTDKLLAAQTLQDNKRALEQSNADLENFAYIASHDLKEPLRMISSFVNLVEKKSGIEFDEKNKQYFWFITDAIGRMRNMIDELLKYSQVGRKNAGFASTNLAEVLEFNIRIFQRQVKEKRANIIIHQLPVINCNATLMEELFRNLISNALKFNHAEKPIIEIGYEAGEKEHKLYVSDNGIGIAPEYTTEIFKMFRRLHSAKVYEGAGIGLALCKRIVEYHHGDIWVEAKPDGGSCFWVSIPNNF